MPTLPPQSSGSDPSELSMGSSPPSAWRGHLPFVCGAIALLILFAGPLIELARIAMARTLYSHIFLIPFICLYLLILRKDKLPPRGAPSFALSTVLIVAALAVLAVSLGVLPGGEPWDEPNRLSGTILAWVLLVQAVGLLCYGRAVMRAALFPALFLLFMVPMPVAVEDALQRFLQVASAEVSYIFLQFSGTPIFRQDLVFHLPGLSVEVAKECSGIRSTLVLFMVGLLAADMFLVTRWKQALMVLAVLPVGIIRNAIRIVTLSLLSLRDPSIMSSPLHHRGGPLFFLLSLVPVLLLLVILRKTEKQQKPNRNHHENRIP